MVTALALDPRLARKGVVVDDEECWLYQGYVDLAGYGRFGKWLAHRLSFVSTFGPPPADAPLVGHACHDVAFARGECAGGRCKHRRCVNPAHLAAMDNSENVRMGAAPHTGFVGRVRFKGGKCQRDHPVGPNDAKCLECAREKGRRWRAKHR